jgi:hypothetical protein
MSLGRGGSWVPPVAVSLSLLFTACQKDSTEPLESQSAALGISWPAGRIFPAFAAPAALDVVEPKNLPPDQRALLVTLQGLVNRSQPRIFVPFGPVDRSLWLVELGVPTTEVADPFELVRKYRAEVSGIIIYDDAVPDTLNLATTLAGIRNAVVASPALAARLTAAPFSLRVVEDLRGRFRGRLDVYRHQIDHLAGEATHRVLIGLPPGIPGQIRDYAVATKAFTVWLDPNIAEEAALLRRYLARMPPNSPFLGWWTEERAGVRIASEYGVPTYPADWSGSLTVFSGMPSGGLPAKPAPPRPPLENKVYVAIFMSDGDNLQENQHLIPLKWRHGRRGQVPISWTVSPATVEIAPTFLRYFQRTATAKDLLVSGPSGLGYTYPSKWPAGKFEDYARVSGRFMDAAHLKIITVWNDHAELRDDHALAYARHVPGLQGMTIHESSTELKMIDGRIPLLRPEITYGDSGPIVQSGIERRVARFTGAAPEFVAVQGNMNDGRMNPDALYEVQQAYADDARVEFVRADHFFSLLDQARRPPQHALFQGDFDGDRRGDALMYYAGDGNLWLGRNDGSQLRWALAGNLANFGPLLGGRHSFHGGDFNGDGKRDLALYHRGDGHLFIGYSNGQRFDFQLASQLSGFGDLMDGSHQMLEGDFDGNGKSDLGFYFRGDGSVWAGLSDGRVLHWRKLGEVGNFGDLLDGRHALEVGDFSGDGKSDLLIHHSRDGHLWLGRSDGATLTWSLAGSAAGLTKASALLGGDFNGDRKRDLLVHSGSEYRFGLFDGSQFQWRVAGTRPVTRELGLKIQVADHDGDGKADVSVYSGASGEWTIGRSDGQSLQWRPAGKSSFGNALDAEHALWFGDLDADGKVDALSYDDRDGEWRAGRSDGSTFRWSSMGNTRGFGVLLK